MSLCSRFFPSPDLLPLIGRAGRQLDVWQIVLWWEIRRPLYNFLVGSAGAFTCIAMITCATICEATLGEPIGMPDPPIFAILGILVFAATANLCYTFGWITEVLAKMVWEVPTRRIGVLAFIGGTAFSIGLALLPLVLTLASLAFQLVFGTLFHQ